MSRQVDFSKIATKPLLPALDAGNNLVYVPSYTWWYLDSDGSIVLDWKRFAEWVEKTGYVVVPEPFETCDEESCHRNWVDCNKFILYPNFEVIEFSEKAYYLKVRRRGDGTAFKVVGPVAVYLLLELEHGMSLCEAILLYTALKAKLRVLSEEELKLLDTDIVGLEAMHAEELTTLLTAIGLVPGLIGVELK
jgi:hypothetical protein